MNIEYKNYPLWQREILFTKINKELPEPKYAIVWEDPDNLEEPAKVTVPSPTWLAMAMHGNILPPVEVYHELELETLSEGFKKHKKGYLLHNSKPVSAMTEEEAMEYLVQKDIPKKVWRDYKGNRAILKIVPKSILPTVRQMRDAWRIKQGTR